MRELQNVIERAVILSEPGEPIGASVLAPMFPGVSINEGSGEHGRSPTPSALAFPEHVVPLESIERQYKMHALRKAKGNRTQTAQMLGISIRTLRNKLGAFREQGDKELESRS